MRPKKLVLLVDADEDHRSNWTFVLETWGYRVLPVASEAEALHVLAVQPSYRVPGQSVEVVMSELLPDGVRCDALVWRATETAGGVPVLLYSRSVVADTAGSRIVDRASIVFLPKALAVPEVLRERLLMMLARKRGPKKRAAAGPEAERAVAA